MRGDRSGGMGGDRVSSSEWEIRGDRIPINEFGLLLSLSTIVFPLLHALLSLI
ncbi:MAG: hypothetical protein F6K09_38645 [Merismopedia sp. SIO2A8]|nr:hypothetical protein [Merismopedia sp. SIO2A8]